MTSFKKIIIVVFSIILIIGCNVSKKEDKGPTNGNNDFIIALIPERNVFEQRKRHKLLCEYLSKKLNLNVVIRTLPNYGMVYDEFVNNKVDGAFFGSFTYVLTHHKVNVEVIARPVWENGSSTYCGYLFVKKDGKIRNIQDSKGKTLVLVDKCTTAGYLFPMVYFKKQGIRDIKKFFKKIFYAGSHDASVLSVFNGEADIGAAKNDLFDKLAKDNPQIKKDLIVIAKSSDVPSNGLAVRNNIDKDLKNRLKDILLNLDKSTEGMKILEGFGARKFIETRDEDYREVYKMAKDLGLDLSGFSYTPTLEE